MEIRIREARAGDAEAIQSLSREALGYDYPAKKLQTKLEALLARPEHKIFVAERDGAVAGYLHLCDYEVLYADPMKNILGIAVSDEHRRQGIGRRLLQAAEIWARETGARSIRLVSGDARTGAHEFYRSQGYAFCKRQLNFSKELAGVQPAKGAGQ